MFPGTEFTTDTGSMNRYAVGYFMEKQAIEWCYAQVLPPGADRASPKVSPLNAKDFSGLPPAYIMLGGYDPLHDEGLAYADKLKAAGVKVTVADYAEMVHCFIYLQSVLPQAHEALANAAEAVAEALDQAITAQIDRARQDLEGRGQQAGAFAVGFHLDRAMGVHGGRRHQLAARTSRERRIGCPAAQGPQSLDQPPPRRAAHHHNVELAIAGFGLGRDFQPAAEPAAIGDRDIGDAGDLVISAVGDQADPLRRASRSAPVRHASAKASAPPNSLAKRARFTAPPRGRTRPKEATLTK